MLVKPASELSIRYISAPTIRTTIIWAPRNTVIFGRLARIAAISSFASPECPTSFNTRKTRSRRRARMTSNDCAPGTSRLRYVGTTANRSTRPKKLVAYRPGRSTL